MVVSGIVEVSRFEFKVSSYLPLRGTITRLLWYFLLFSLILQSCIKSANGGQQVDLVKAFMWLDDLSAFFCALYSAIPDESGSYIHLERFVFLANS